MADVFIVALVLLIAGGVAARILLPRIQWETPRIVRGTEFTDEKLRKAAIKAANEAQIAGMGREKAQAHIEELVRHAVGKEYASIYPGTPIEVTENWPTATCIITENIAVIEIWVGHSHDAEGIRPVRAEVRGRAPLKLDTRRPIRAVLDEMDAPPPKAAPDERPRIRRRPTGR